MRLCLVAHGFPPLEKAGVENFTAQLARGLAARGHRVEVFVPRARKDLPDLSIRREERDGYGLSWLSANSSPGDPRQALDPPGRAEQFDLFLERERPELVHFHHLTKLGLGLVEVARARGIATVYTVHDYFPVCHRIALLRPDLTRCETLGAPAVCARCDLALAVLNQQPELGDYHLGAFGESLAPEARERLVATLAEDREASGFSPEEWTAAIDLRRELDERRRMVFEQVDRLIAPTEFLAERLVEGGLAPDRIVRMPYGIDTGSLRSVPRATPEELSTRAPRVGFIGSLTKHKGVHVLLDAWERLAPAAELHLWGDSTDRAYVARCRAQAERIGARMHGAFEQRRLAAILGSVDLVVVPSIWVENYPIAIREALAAGRGVVASDVGAIPESVREGIDGRRFRVGDPQDLARVLGELLGDPSAIARLAEDRAGVLDLDQHVLEHERLYARVRRELDERRPDAPPVLPHLVEISRQRDALLALSTSELFARSLRGLERLGRVLGAAPDSPAELLTRALTRDVRTQERLRDRTTERDYLRSEIEAHERSQAALRADSDWRAGQVTGFEQAIRSLEAEREWLRESVAHLEARVTEVEHARDWQADNVRNLTEKSDWLETEVANRDDQLAQGERLRRELEQDLVRTRAEADEAAEAADEFKAELKAELEHFRAGLDELGAKLSRAQARIDALTDDLARTEAERSWRASEMKAALAELDSIRGRLLPARFLVNETLARWRAADESDGDEGGPT